MKKILLSFLLIPCLIFCQEEKNYNQVISLSEFYTQLELAQSKSTDLILENCIIKGDNDGANFFESNKNKNQILDNDSCKINLLMINCKTESRIELSEYNLNNLEIRRSELKGFRIDDCEIANLYLYGVDLVESSSAFYVVNSTIHNTEIITSKFNERLHFGNNIIGRVLINKSEFLEFDSANLKLQGNKFTTPEDSYWYNNPFRTNKIYNNEPWLEYDNAPRVTFINDSTVSHRESNIEIFNSNFNGILYLSNNSFNDSVNSNIKLLDYNLVEMFG
jgi:hypothetical protein